MDRRTPTADRPARRREPGSATAAGLSLLFSLSLLIVAGAPSAATAQEAAPDTADRSVRALSLEAAGLLEEEGEGEPPIRLDGRLTERAWKQAPAASGLRQRNPDAGDPATEETEVRVAYGSEAMYVAVRATDSEPGRIIARTLERDAVMRASGFGGLQFTGDDGVALLFDTFHDHRNGMVFATNPRGAKFEALLTDQGQQINVEWRAVWEVEARRTEDGWTAEFRLPFRTLRYPSGDGATDGQTWGFNVSRMIRRKNEQVLWSSWRRDAEGLIRVSRAGHLTGLRDLPRTGLNLEVQPYVLSGVTEEQQAAGQVTDTRLKVGGTAKYQLTPGLVLDLTGNPDFAQVEVDREEVNLTRFSLFFPEKRDFFLENAGVFDFGMSGFGPSPPPFQLFFSRRIGFHEDETVPLLGGARLSGRAGSQTVGMLDVVTGEDGDVSRKNYGVARVKRDVGADGYVGAMVTDIRRGLGSEPGGGAAEPVPESNTAAGVDWSLWTGERWNWRGFLAGTRTEGPGGDDLAYRVAGEYSSDFFSMQTGHLFVGPETNAAMGFVLRHDIHRTDGFYMIVPRPDVLGIRRINMGLSGQHVADESWEVKDWEFGPFVSPTWDSGEDFRITYDRSFTRLEEPFELADQVTVPAGEYDMWALNTRFETSSNRPVWGVAQFNYRRFFDGTLVTAGGDLNLNAGAHLGLQARYRHNDVEVPWGEFTSDVLSLNLKWAASRELTGNVRVQYNSLEDRINTKARVRLIHQPGSDLFLVFTEQRGPGFVGTATAGTRPAGRLYRPSLEPGLAGIEAEGAAGAGAHAGSWRSAPGAAPGIRPGLRPAPPARGQAAGGGSIWDVRSRGAVVKLTYLLRL